MPAARLLLFPDVRRPRLPMAAPCGRGSHLWRNQSARGTETQFSLCGKRCLPADSATDFQDWAARGPCPCEVRRLVGLLRRPQPPPGGRTDRERALLQGLRHPALCPDRTMPPAAGRRNRDSADALSQPCRAAPGRRRTKPPALFFIPGRAPALRAIGRSGSSRDTATRSCQAVGSGSYNGKILPLSGISLPRRVMNPQASRRDRGGRQPDG